MEDENLTTSNANVEGDVVIEQTPSQGMTPAPEPSTPPMEPSTETTPQTTGAPDYERTQAVQTAKTLAENYIDDARANSYANKGHGVSDWIKNVYNYDQRQAGTMWVAGKINDVATQMSFLEATLNEDMYSEMDLQKYFFDTNLATARAYAKEKRHETAYGYYRAAQEKALAEGDLTGWYMPAEANYMLAQWSIANENLKDPNLGTMDQARARSVKSAVEGWFNANNITWRGIECLNHLYYQETVRHNKELERLQADQNEIAKLQNAATRAANAANAGSAKGQLELQERKWEWQMQQLELTRGIDLTGDNYIGYKSGVDNKLFGGYSDRTTWVVNNLDSAFKNLGSDYVKSIVGEDRFQICFNTYKYTLQNGDWFKQLTDAGAKYIPADSLNKLGNAVLTQNGINNLQDKAYGSIIKDGTVRMVYTSPEEVALYVFNESGMAYRINDETTKLTNGKTIGQMLELQGLKLNTSSKNSITSTNSDGNSVTLNIGITNYGKYSLMPSENTKAMYPEFTDKGLNGLNKALGKGYKIEEGLVDTAGDHMGMVLSSVDKEGNKKYYAFNPSNGKYAEVKAKDVVSVKVENYKLVARDLDGNIQNSGKSIEAKLISLGRYSPIIGNLADGEYVRAHVNSDGEIDAYFSIDKNGDFEFHPKQAIENRFGQPKINKIESTFYNYVNDIPEEESMSVKTLTVSDLIDKTDSSITEKDREEFNEKMKKEFSQQTSLVDFSKTVSGSQQKTTKEGNKSTKPNNKTKVNKESDDTVLGKEDIKTNYEVIDDNVKRWRDEQENKYKRTNEFIEQLQGR